MGWIDAKEQLPPMGLDVLVEVSGYYSGDYCAKADHDFFIGSWIKTEFDSGHWLLWDATPPTKYEKESHIINPEVFAWMPLPEHYQPKEVFGEENDDLFEHAMFEEDPDYLYKGKYTYEQMSLDDFLKGAGQDDRRRD